MKQLSTGDKVVYRNTILATIDECLSDTTFRIKLHDHATEKDPHYSGTVCGIEEIQPLNQ